MEAARASTMNGPWAARLAVSEASSAAALRRRADVQAAVVDDVLWLRGDRADAELDRLLDFVAPQGRYEVLPDGQLRPAQLRLPVAVLPAVRWRLVAEVFDVAWPQPAAASRLPAGVTLRLTRSDREQPANALLADLTSFGRWASQAAAIRLSPLRFAATATEALVLGCPVPAAPGPRLYEASGIVVPCGWQIAPAIDAPSLRLLLTLGADDVALFSESGWQLIAADRFVTVTRSAVRLTIQGVGRG